jgi:hypothetical protein
LLADVAQAAAAAPLRVEGTEWVLEEVDGTQLRSRDLVGAELRLEVGTVLRIDSVEQRGDTSGLRWWAHELSVQVPGRGWQALCEPHSDGTRYAVVLPGRQQPDGSLAEDPSAFAISCTSGALAKCLRIGYEPWQGAPGGGTLRATYNACIRMIRADYTGQGVPYTANGRQIDVYDIHGIQAPADLPDQAFEAGWDDRGAVCVHHVRVSDKVTLQALEATVPRLRGNVGEVCTEAHARALGALVFNRSASRPAAAE